MELAENKEKVYEVLLGLQDAMRSVSMIGETMYKDNQHLQEQLDKNMISGLSQLFDKNNYKKFKEELIEKIKYEKAEIRKSLSDPNLRRECLLRIIRDLAVKVVKAVGKAKAKYVLQITLTTAIGALGPAFWTIIPICVKLIDEIDDIFM